MCLDPECKWITIVEDDKSGQKCYIHYKFNVDGSFEEMYTEGDLSLKAYVEIMKEEYKKLLPKNYPLYEAPHYPEMKLNDQVIQDYAGNLFTIGELIANDAVDLEIVDLSPKRRV